MSETLSVAKQTELDEPITIPLNQTTRTHSQLIRWGNVMREDGMDPEQWCGLDALTRYKTKIEVRTREEAASLSCTIGQVNPKSSNVRKTLDRVYGDLSEGLLRQGLTLDSTESAVELPDVVELDVDPNGEPPSGIAFQPGDVVKVRASALGHEKMGEDGELTPDSDLTSVTVDTLAADHALVEDTFSTKTWLPFTDIHSLDTEEMNRREIRRSIREKRGQADMDALLDLCKRHAEQVASEVWPSGTVPVEEITFAWNNQFSWLGGRYTRRTDWKNNGPKIELAPDLYRNRGLDYLLSVVRHELIHAWQDYHPDGHPEDTHDHHGRDFYQWVDELETHRHCSY